MYKIITISILAFGIVNANSLSSTCQNKIDDLNKQIELADKYGHSEKVKGLKSALDEIREKCSDNRISDELKSKITKYENKIKETQEDIEVAKIKGKTLKAKTEEAKLKTLQSELEQAKKDLANLTKK